MYIKAFKERESAKLKLWQTQTNTAAWLQGQYIARAIGACIPGGPSYPERPLHLLKDDGAELEEEIPAETQSSDDAIRAQSEKLDRILAAKDRPPKEIIGAKRV